MTTTKADTQQLAVSLVDALKGNRLEDAESIWHLLRDTDDVPQEAHAFPAFIMIQRGKAIEALQYLNTLPAECCPDVRALCLYLVGDPTWHSHAAALADNPDEGIKSAMRHLLEAPVEEAR
jgi:type III secretion protein HrpB1